MDRLQEGMEKAYAAGRKVLTVEDVAANIADLYRIMQRERLALKDIAKACNISESTVYRVVHGEYDAKGPRARQTVDKVQAWLLEKAGEKRTERAG